MIAIEEHFSEMVQYLQPCYPVIGIHISNGEYGARTKQNTRQGIMT